MDEATRIIIAYAAVLTGIPILAAKILWAVPGAISYKLLTPVSSRLDEITDEAFAGFISLLLACLFEHLGLEIAFKIPLMLIIVNAVWKKEAHHPVSFMVGAMAGFVLHARVLPHLSSALLLATG